MLKALLFLIVTGFSWVSVGAVVGHVERRGLHLAHYQIFSCLFCVGLGIASWATAPSAFFPRSGCPVSTWVGVLVGTLSCGVFEYLMIQAMGRAMKRGPNSIVWAIIQSGLIYPFLMGWLVFGVPMGLRRLAGIAMIIASVFLYAATKRPAKTAAPSAVGDEVATAPSPSPPVPDPPAPLRQWLVPAVLGMLCCGINQCGANLPSYLERGQDFSGAFRTLLISLGMLLTALVHFAIRSVRGTSGAPPRKGELRLLAGYAAVLGGLSFLTSRFLRFPGLDILQKHDAGSMGYPVMVAACIIGFFVYGRLVLRERIAWKQAVGAVVGLAGILLGCL